MDHEKNVMVDLEMTNPEEIIIVYNFTLEELHTIYKLLERQYIGYENIEAVKLIRQIQKILYNHGLIE